MGGVGVLVLGALLSAAAPNPNAPLAEAAMRGDAETVRALLRSGADVDAALPDGMTALHWAARNADAELTRELLRARADANVITRIGAITPLHMAARTGSAPTVRLLLEAGALVDARTTTGGATPLHFAAGGGHRDAVAALLDHGAQVDAREGAWEQTPLMWAAAGDEVEVVRMLIARGADLAAMSRIEDLSERALADDLAKAERDQRIHDATGGRQGAPSMRGVSPQALAEQQAAEEASGEPRPLSYNDLIGMKGGMTALHFAVRQGNTAAALALLEAGADIDQPTGGDRTTPLLAATLNGHWDLASKLLERGADPRLANDGGATPLYATINLAWAPKVMYPHPVAWEQQRTGYLELMEAFLKAGADPDARLTRHLWFTEYNSFGGMGVNTTGATAFWRAAHGLDLDAMRLLVRYGADPSLPTLRVPDRRRAGASTEDPSGLPPVPVGGPGVYPIHAASGVGHGTSFAANTHRHAPDGWLPAVRYLVEEHGADVNARDHDGYNPIHHAASRGDNELIRYLIERGGDVMAVSRRDQTTVDMANGPNQRITPHPETIRLLEGLGVKNNNRCVSC